MRRADRILTLEGGRLIEDGSHDELINSGGRYATLHRIQAGIHEMVEDEMAPGTAKNATDEVG